jgi:hypothetical protein
MDDVHRDSWSFPSKVLEKTFLGSHSPAVPAKATRETLFGFQLPPNRFRAISKTPVAVRINAPTNQPNP